MSNEQPNFKDVMARLRREMDQLIMENVAVPVEAAAKQIPAIMQRRDLSEEDKVSMLEELQLSMVAPFVGALVYVALLAKMDLPTLLYNLGQGWEEIRSKHMAQTAQEILNKGARSEETTQ